MKTILHISADFPDPMVPRKTKAVERLVDAANGFRHVVYSINRVNWRTDVATLCFGKDRIALAYGAPPFAFRLLSHLDPVADAIEEDLRRRNITPDLIHAHKFTVEGVIADRLATRLGTPFIANLWGDTDTRLFEAKPGLRARYRDIARRVALLLPPAPWTAHYFTTALGVPMQRMKVLPVMPGADDIIPPRPCKQPHILTVFGWEAWQRKGFDILLPAVAEVAEDVPEVLLDVLGCGDPKALLEITRLVERSSVANRVKLCHPVDNAKIQKVMNGYSVFAMPSRRETYGMVFVEALLAGVPILWPENQGIDGLFDGMRIGCATNAQSVADVADGLRMLLIQEERLKAEIGRLQKEGAFEHVRRSSIVARYRDILTAITAGDAASEAA
jgi:glycosyltransferase involved in cell wall biosynthesis